MKIQQLVSIVATTTQKGMDVFRLSYKNEDGHVCKRDIEDYVPYTSSHLARDILFGLEGGADFRTPVTYAIFALRQGDKEVVF